MYLQDLIEKYSQTVGERSEIDNIMMATLLLQRFLGHQVLDPTWTWRKFCQYQVFLLSLLIYVVCGTLNVINKPNVELQLMAEGSYTLLVITLTPLKLFLYINNRNILRSMYLTVKTKLFDIIRADQTVCEGLKRTNKIINAVFLMMMLPFLAYECVTFWNYFAGNRKWMSTSCDTLLPMTSPYYEITWFLHSMFMVEMCEIMFVIDMWFVFFMSFFCLASDCVVKILQVPRRFEGESREEYRERLRDALRMFHENHVKLVKYIESIGKMYKWLALLPLINAAISICIILLVLRKELNPKFAPHILPVLGKVFAYSWFGEQLKEKMFNFKMALLSFDWRNLDRTQKRNYYIVLQYSDKQFGIKTAIGHDLSMVTMATVLKSSYQAFTMLQSVN